MITCETPHRMWTCEGEIETVHEGYGDTRRTHVGIKDLSHLLAQYKGRRAKVRVEIVDGLATSPGSLPAREAAPVPMLLWCPECRGRHIDEGEFATKVHHTHACQHCGHVWRPAIVPTVGVQFLPGFKNEKPSEFESTPVRHTYPPNPLEELVGQRTKEPSP